jgi:feruloyl esterase
MGALTAPAAVAKTKPALPTCTGSLSAAVAGIVPKTLPGFIVTGSLAIQLVPAAPEVPANPPAQPTPIGPTPAYCQVNLTYSSGLQGPGDGYNFGAQQQIKILVLLPLSAADGGNANDGVQGNWNGNSMVFGSSGMSAALVLGGFGDGLNRSDTGYPIRLGYVGSISDNGETAAGLANNGVAASGNFPLITIGSLTGTLSTGAIADWTHRGTHYAKQWADAIAEVYYGKEPKRHYYNGSSGGGNMGMGQLQNYGDEYDGFLIGAPAYYWSQLVLAQGWPTLVFKKLTQMGEALPTPAQASALTAAVYAACDMEGVDVVADGIVEDPRECKFSAHANVCGLPTAPASPNCLTVKQAAAFDRIWDGPRNHLGKRIWFPFTKTVPFGGAFNLAITNTVGGFVPAVLKWDHKDPNFDPNNFFVDAESMGLAGSPTGGITYEDEAVLSAKMVDDLTDNQNFELSKAAHHGAKVIQLHGNADGAIPYRDDINFYNRVATWYSGGTTRRDYEKLRKWYRFFTMVGVGHSTGATGGGVGPSPFDPFLVLRDWVERDIVPHSMPTLAAGNAVSPGRTRPICPWPEMPIYKGSGSTDDASSFYCGGNLATLPLACDEVITVYKQENTGNLDFKGVGLDPDDCKPGHNRDADRDRDHGDRG